MLHSQFSFQVVSYDSRVARETLERSNSLIMPCVYVCVVYVGSSLD